MRKPEATPTMFPDKKRASTNFDRVTSFITEAQSLSKEADVGQERATFIAQGEYPELPVCLLYMTDIHYGNMGVDYELLQEHFEILEDTPNFFAVLGGDDIDAFSPTAHPSGMMGDAITPQMQAQAFLDLISQLDRKSKIALIEHGNHTDWIDKAGYDFANTFYNELQAPVFKAGGVLEVLVGGVNYRVGINHTHWGNSKINPTNSPKRMMEYSYPGIDIALVGHTHQAAGEQFDRAGENKIAVVGGTYKLKDPFGEKWGMGKAGSPGYTVMLWPGQKRMELFKDPRVAQHYMLLMAVEQDGRDKVTKRKKTR